MTDLTIKTLHREDISPDFFRAIEEFCSKAEAESKFQSQNWSAKDWEERQETFLNCIFKQNRFDRGKGILTFALENENIIACSGAYQLEERKNIVVLGVRTFTLESHRGTANATKNWFLQGAYLLPEQQRWAYTQDASRVLLTFNDYNLWLKKFVLRLAKGHSIGLGFSVPPQAKEFYQGFEEHPKQFVIQGTSQHVLYKDIQPS